VGDGQSGTTPVHNVNVYDVRGTIFFPIFTGGRTRGEIEEAKGILGDVTAARDRDRAQIETDVLTAISGVEWALKQVATSAENVGLSRKEVELTRARFLQGVADNTEVVNAQDRLSKADDARIRAQYTLGLSRANLARAIGGAERAYRK
jgi:outer membrane protein TolC